jgi:hypothetical protein
METPRQRPGVQDAEAAAMNRVLCNRGRRVRQETRLRFECVADAARGVLKLADLLVSEDGAGGESP